MFMAGVPGVEAALAAPNADRPHRRTVGARPVGRERPEAQPSLMAPPSTVTGTGGSGFGAGPPDTEPSATLNLLPWQLQLMVPFLTSLTVQPACVQIAEKALMVPACGCVST